MCLTLMNKLSDKHTKITKGKFLPFSGTRGWRFLIGMKGNLRFFQGMDLKTAQQPRSWRGHNLELCTAPYD